MMDTVTYSEPAVSDAIMRDFIPVQVNVTEEAGKTVIDCYRQFWTPDIRLLDCIGFELYRWNGYLPPFEFLPQLMAGRGQVFLRLNDNHAAADVYEQILRRFPSSYAAPEAEYFLGVSRYKDSHEPSDLTGAWEHLRTRHPNSIWRTKQSFSENFPPPREQPKHEATREEVKSPAPSGQRA
jgi:hypothetical protein